MRSRNPTVSPPRALPIVFYLIVSVVIARSSSAQSIPYERAFPQSQDAVEKAIKALQSSSAGRLPVLDGFVVPSDLSLERFQRGYYQCTVQVSSKPSGGSLVRVSAKITAWYADPAPSKSGYRALSSNGRLEADFLDRLQETLGGDAPSSADLHVNSVPSWHKSDLDSPAPNLSPPGPITTAPGVRSKTPGAPASSPFKMGAPMSQDWAASLATQRAVTDRHVEELTKEAKNLEEILRNQGHPNNLVAVRKSGTPVLASPSEGAKVLFLAAVEDEFETLDLNANWVHVRISGLSRGWIRRSSLEIPSVLASDKPHAETPAESESAPVDKQPLEVESEQIASFPGKWEPLRGKTVKIVSVQKTDKNANATGSGAKLAFAKSLFDREYAELAKVSTSIVGVVVIFDSEDGGMVAATVPALQQWKAGTLSDEAFFRRCFFDPPEAFGTVSRP